MPLTLEKLISLREDVELAFNLWANYNTNKDWLNYLKACKNYNKYYSQNHNHYKTSLVSNIKFSPHFIPPNYLSFLSIKAKSIRRHFFFFIHPVEESNVQKKKEKDKSTAP